MLAPEALDAQARAGASSDPAQNETPPQELGARTLQVFLLTMDRGDQVYEMFGHNALLIRDVATGEMLAWNWGLFNFQDVDFIPRFLRGTMRYSMGPAELGPFLESYARANRSVYAHELRLSPVQAAELDSFVRWNFLPENRPYIYDYYRDNCSTRVRDALDRVLGGQLAAHFTQVETGRSYRWYSRRQVQVESWVDQGLSYLLGMRGDRPLSVWEAMFLPVELMEALEGFEVESDQGHKVALLGPRETWFEAERGPLPDAPPTPALPLLLVGTLLGLLVVWLGKRSAPRSSSAVGKEGAGSAPWAPRLALATLAVLFGGLSTLLGLLVMVAWGTDHYFIQANLNPVYLNPLSALAALMLALALSAPGRALGFWGRGAAGLYQLIGGVTLVTLVLQATPLLSQGNLDVIFLAAPINLAFARAAWLATRVNSKFSPASGFSEGMDPHPKEQA
jgi:hypothetical protein